MSRERDLSWLQIFTIVLVACSLGFGYFHAVEWLVP